MGTRSSYRLQPADVSLIKKRLACGEMQHDIAADFKCNQGRISEIKTGQTFKEIPPAD